MNYRLKQQEKAVKAIENHGFVWARIVEQTASGRLRYVGYRIMWIKN